MVCASFSTCVKTIVRFTCCVQRQMSMTSHIVSQSPNSSCCFLISNGYARLKHSHKYVRKTNSCSSIIDFRTSLGSSFRSYIFKQRSNCHSLAVKSVANVRQPQKINLDFSFGCQSMNVKFLLPNQGIISKVKCNVGPLSWPRGCASTGLFFGLLVCCSTSEPVRAEAAQLEDKNKDKPVNNLHGKKVYTDYSITGIPGDGRCLFRSVAHGACLRSGKPAPSEGLQRELADELRTRVADEFVKRRQETEWFIEGEFDTYVSQIRKPHVWGGEPELFMASHVLKMPITVYMYDKDCGGLISIAEYGEEYGKENPIRVLYHGFGHYEALQIPGKEKGVQSKL